ncbi:MAG: hypothetical protein OSB74_03995 [Verrucomicrobiota bacterium]|nr:hypothetical protein [Verrucomicrobiota bacterium]
MGEQQLDGVQELGFDIPGFRGATSPFGGGFQIAIHAFGPVKCVGQLELRGCVIRGREGLEFGSVGVFSAPSHGSTHQT